MAVSDKTPRGGLLVERWQFESNPLRGKVCPCLYWKLSLSIQLSMLLAKTRYDRYVVSS